MEEIKGYEVLQVAAPSQAQLIETLDRAERANIDIQVSTAKQYPRSISRCVNNAVAIATMDKETAQSCGYALPRGGKPITGPSVHLAKIIAQQYGNLRAEAKVMEITDRQVVSRGTAWDLENNYAVAFEVRRSIIGKGGSRYSDDMITVTGNAANSIAYRNAIFGVVPKSITDKAYQAAQHLITGDLSDEEKLIKRRDGAIKHFVDTYAITEEEVVKLCGKHTINQIQAPEIALLIGFAQSLKDGDTTVDELMAPFRKNKAKTRSASAKSFDEDSIEEVGAVDMETGEIKGGKLFNE
mgnify:CR=1 FL=1